MKRVGVLISGEGTNLQALIDTQPQLGAYEIAVVISNVGDAFGLERARKIAIPALHIDHKPFGKDRAAFEREIDAALRAHGVEIVALAGFMRVLTPFLVGAWRGRMINIHPSLLPAFTGRDTHARALAAGVKLHGCTAHIVSDDLDAGPIIGQAALKVTPADTPETLAARVRPLEHRLYPLCLAALCGGRVGDSDDPAVSVWVR